MIYESKMNWLTLEELELIDPNPSSVIINKLLNQSVNRNKTIDNAVNKLAKEIALIETNRRVNNKEGAVCITFNSNKGRWVSQRKINGTTVHIKSSKNKEVVLKAYYDYCERNFLST